MKKELFKNVPLYYREALKMEENKAKVYRPDSGSCKQDSEVCLV